MAGRKKEPHKDSQFDEEFILRGLFKTIPGGRAADIGARSRTGSNVAWCIDGGWEVQVIDRNPNGLFKDFGPNKFPKVSIVGAVVTPQNVNKLLWKGIDLLSIDIDGPDADVWEAIEARPRVLCIEAMEENREKIVEISRSRGYKLHAETGPNLIYVLPGPMKRVNDDWWPERDTTCYLSSYTMDGADLAISFCKKTDLVIQAGGNVGVWPRYLRTKFKRVLTFEPSPENYELMLKNLSGLDIGIHQAALGAHRGTCGLRLNPDNCGDDQTTFGEGVQVVTIDDLHVDPDLIYLDIQGDELPAINGAKNTINRCSPVIAIEVDNHQMKRNGDPRPLLEKLGYKLRDHVHQDYIYTRD